VLTLPARRTLRPKLTRLARSDVMFVPFVLFAAFLIAGGVASEQWQGVITTVAVIAAGCLYLRHPRAALFIVLSLWVLGPFLRRIINYITFTLGGAGILSVAPFAATAVVSILAMISVRPSRRLVAAALLVLAGFAIGIPTGLSSPLSVAFGLFAYGSAVLALFLGYAEERSGRHTLEILLLCLMPVVTVYGLWQYLGSELPPWDSQWLVTSSITTVGAKGRDSFRMFSMLNSPATLASLLAVFLCATLVAPKLTPVRLINAALALVCIALTAVRSAWLALAVALIVIVIVSHGQVLRRIALLLVILGGVYLLAGNSAATQQVTQRVTTFGDVSGDASFKERLRQIRVYGPQAVSAPLGHGLGTVGQAARVRATSFGEFEDNGYLMLAFQVGPGGFAIVMGTIFWLLGYGVRAPNAEERRRRLPLVAPVIAALVIMLAGDALYGLTGFIVWYCLGALLARHELSRDAERLAAESPVYTPPAPPRVTVSI
jgi:putative inorganic carbon (HCO3(-)) transporter